LTKKVGEETREALVVIMDKNKTTPTNQTYREKEISIENKTISLTETGPKKKISNETTPLN
jgi:hypothetical protein